MAPGASGSDPLLVVGIDEAGYGPLLGPLCLGASVWRLRGWEADLFRADPRQALAGLLCPAEAPRSPEPLPVPVGDSKVIHRRFGRAGLARGVGAFAATLGVAPPADLRDLIDRFSARDAARYAGRPWYEALEGSAVPGYPWTGPLAEAAEARGVEAVDLRVLAVDAGELNDAFDALQNKARTLGLYAAELLTGILETHPDREVVVAIDRHGGRKNYLPLLTSWFPFAKVEVASAVPGEARYTMEVMGRSVRFVFVTKGDRQRLAIGLASMAAKLARELFMDRLNAWFADRCPSLRPTAGYVQDGRRFLDDVEAVLVREGIPRRALVRLR